MTTEEFLKEMNVLEEKAAKFRDEIIAIDDYSIVKPKLDELEAISNRMFEIYQMNQAVLLENLFEELEEYFGL